MVPASSLLARTGTVCTAAMDAVSVRENRKKKVQIDSARIAHNGSKSHVDSGSDLGPDSRPDSDSDSDDELFLYLSQDTDELRSSH